MGIADQELQRQANFVSSRSRVYVGGDAYQRQLDGCVRGPSLTFRPLSLSSAPLVAR